MLLTGVLETRTSTSGVREKRALMRDDLPTLLLPMKHTWNTHRQRDITCRYCILHRCVVLMMLCKVLNDLVDSAIFAEFDSFTEFDTLLLLITRQMEVNTIHSSSDRSRAVFNSVPFWAHRWALKSVRLWICSYISVNPIYINEAAGGLKVTLACPAPLTTDRTILT